MEDLKGVRNSYWSAEGGSCPKDAFVPGGYRKQINRLGDTPFEIKRMDIDMDDGVFMPLSLINELRRTAVSI